MSYDDFDDDGDPHPSSASPPPKPEPAHAPANQGSLSIGSSYVSMELNNGLLPVRCEFSTNWSQQISPGEVGRELFKAYEAAILRLLARTVEAHGGWPKRRMQYACATPRRKQLELLLDTTTWDQYDEVLKLISSFGDYGVHGPTLEYDQPVMTVGADRFSLKSIAVWPQWSGCADTWALRNELLDCADRIRAKRPRFMVQGDYSRYTEDELEDLNRRHYSQLIERKRGY